jgi:hypothetical protein
MTLLKNDPWFANKPERGFASIVTADGAAALDTNSAAWKEILTAPADGLLVDSLIVASNDSAARVLAVAVKVGSTINLIGCVSIPANSGTNGTVAAVDLLANTILLGLPISAQGKRFIRLKPTEILVVGTTSAVTAALSVRVSASGVSFVPEV